MKAPVIALHIDKFGNLITSIPAEMVNRLDSTRRKKNLVLFIGEKEVGGYKDCYAAAHEAELFFLVGSLGLVEVAAKGSSASPRIKPKRKDPVTIRIRRE